MKIYKLVNEEGLIYIGKTTSKYLSTRLAIHKSQALTKRNINKCTSSILFNNNSKVKIILLEETTDNKKELEYINLYDCVNKNKTGLALNETKKNWLEKTPNYYKEYNKKKHAWVNKTFKCECGKILKNCSKTKHLLTKSHLIYIDGKNE